MLLLSDWMGESRTSVAKLALTLDVSKQAIYLWLSGETYPSAKHLLSLLRLSGGEVTVESFSPAIDTPFKEVSRG